MTDETATNPGEGDDLSLGTGVADHIVESDEQDIDQPDEGEEGAEGAAETEVELEEVEHDGQTYKVPKALKPALMMQADYTRKTQELAEQRRNWEAERAQQAEAVEATIAERAQLRAVDDRLAQFKQVDWAGLSQSDPATAMQLRMQYDQLREARTDLAGQIEQKSAEALEAKRVETAKRIQDGLAELTRDIPGFNLELVGKLTDHAAKTFGFTSEELSAIDDPRIIKVLHRLYEHDTKAAAAAKVKATQQKQQTAPAQQLRGANGKFSVDATTNDFAAFEKMADAKLQKRA